MSGEESGPRRENEDQEKSRGDLFGIKLEGPFSTKLAMLSTNNGET